MLGRSWVKQASKSARIAPWALNSEPRYAFGSDAASRRRSVRASLRARRDSVSSRLKPSFCARRQISAQECGDHGRTALLSHRRRSRGSWSNACIGSVVRRLIRRPVLPRFPRRMRDLFRKGTLPAVADSAFILQSEALGQNGRKISHHLRVHRRPRFEIRPKRIKHTSFCACTIENR